MAAWSKAYCLRQYLLITLLLLLDVLLADNSSNISTGGDVSAEDRDRTSVKKELRNPNRWMGAGLAEEEEIEPIKGFYLDEGSQMLASFFSTVSNEELGVTALQTIYDSLPFGVVEKDDASRVKDLSDRLQRKLSHYSSLVNLSRNAIEELFWHHLHRPLSTPAPCCELPDSMLRYESHFGAPVSEELSCDVTVPNHKPLSFAPGHNLTDVFANNLKMSPSIKWQYFLSADGGLSEYPAHRIDNKSGCNKAGDRFRRRNLYLSSVYPEPKFVVMVIDHGSALSPNQLSIAKAIGKYIISSLSDKDHIGLIALSDELHYAGVGDCFTRGMTRASRQTKFKLSRFIESLTKAKAPANHSLGFQQALDMARQAMLMSGNEAANSQASVNNCASGNQTCGHMPPSVGDCPTASSNPVLLMYISRGLLSSLAEPRQVLELIALGQLCLQGRLVINTYALIDDGKPIMYEKAFLQDVALQNYSRYNVSFAALERLPIMRGQALAINSTRWLSSTVGDYQSVLLNSSAVQQTTVTYSPPYWDQLGKGLVVSLTQPCFHLDLLVGAVGLDVHLADLVEDFTYFNVAGGRSYVFLIDMIGTVLMHPTLSRPNTVSEETVATDIGFLEYRSGFAAIRRRILTSTSGSGKLTFSSTEHKEEEDGVKSTTLTYTWERVGSTPYIACIVTRSDKDGSDVQALRRLPPTSLPDLVYHRLDVVSSPSKVDLCRYFRQHSTLAAGSLFLSPAAHVSSFQFESWAEPSPLVIQSFMAFLSDKTKLIANPGLRSAVRSDVGALAQLVPYWRSQFSHSILSQFIVRRYAATATSGVMIEYPATVRPASFDPLRRPWYQKAVEFPGKVVVTGPSLDPSGSGYVVSISHTVYEGKSSTRHSPTDDVVAVLGADLTLAYMHRMLWATLPFCPDRAGQVRGSSIRCFIMDERGYLLVHPNLLDPSPPGSQSNIEQQHLTHHEPLVASDLLNHDRFVLKKACSSYPDRTVQRFYQLNLTLNDQWIDSSGSPDMPVPVLTNLVHGEHCIRYQIVAIQGTNLFVGVVNQTCESATAFCPCSTVDRLCLNCHRMEQSECECPCECPLELDTCINMSDTVQSEADGLPTCPAQPEMSSSPPPPPSQRSRDVELLPACLALDCEGRLSERECFGVVGCEWCVRDTDGHSSLQVPFCTQHFKCYGGVLRGSSPYTEDTNNGGMSTADIDSTFKSLPVGPVAGGVMAFFCFVALSIYCYRQQTRRRNHGVGSGGYGSGSGAGLRMTQLDNDMDEHDDIEPDGDETTAVVTHEFSLAGGIGLDNVAIVSPYRVNTGYRRPAGGDSDHGYSTMTHDMHEDSEHTASYVEPLLVGRDRYRPTGRSVSTGSFSSRASSPLGPVYPTGRIANQRITSPGTLLESADELEAENNEKRQKELMNLHSSPPIRMLDDSLGMTILPDSSLNQLIVPVTVHMVDTS